MSGAEDLQNSDGIQGIVNEGVEIVSYNPHFEGAITLLRIREEEQFSTDHGTEMFDFVMQVLVSGSSNSPAPLDAFQRDASDKEP